MHSSITSMSTKFGRAQMLHSIIQMEQKISSLLEIGAWTHPTVGKNEMRKQQTLKQARLLQVGKLGAYCVLSSRPSCTQESYILVSADPHVASTQVFFDNTCKLEPHYSLSAFLNDDAVDVDTF